MNYIKKYFRYFVFIFTIIFLFGCSHKAVKEGSYKTSLYKNSVSAKENTKKQGATLNKINFEEIKDESKLPPNMNYSINALKANKGYILYNYDGYYYITIFSGQKNTGGHSIQVISVEENSGKTNILVEEKIPQAGDIVTQAITYPYITIKIINIIPSFTITNTSGDTYEKLMKEGEMY